MPPAPEPLKEAHNVADFNCDEPALDAWLKEKALSAGVARTANTFVVCRDRRVVGYYSLATATVPHNTTNAKNRRNSPDPIPAMLLARLACDESEKGKGLGRDLLLDASRRVLGAAESVAARLLVVHPISKSAEAFYEKYGCRPLKGGSDAMCVSLDTLADGL